jgi:hypothetical protein
MMFLAPNARQKIETIDTQQLKRIYIDRSGKKSIVNVFLLYIQSKLKVHQLLKINVYQLNQLDHDHLQRQVKLHHL